MEPNFGRAAVCRNKPDKQRQKENAEAGRRDLNPEIFVSVSFTGC